MLRQKFASLHSLGQTDGHISVSIGYWVNTVTSEAMRPKSDMHSEGPKSEILSVKSNTTFLPLIFETETIIRRLQAAIPILQTNEPNSMDSSYDIFTGKNFIKNRINRCCMVTAVAKATSGFIVNDVAITSAVALVNADVMVKGGYNTIAVAMVTSIATITVMP